MFYKFFPVLVTLVGANPIFIGTPLSLEHGYPGVNLQQISQGAGLLNQPLGMLYQYGNLEQIGGALSKGLLMSHLAGQKLTGSPFGQFSGIGGSIYPIAMKKGMEFPEKTIAGALIKQIPKVSKLPIAVSYPPKPLEFSSLLQSGILAEGLSGASLVPGKSFVNELGISLGY